MNDINNSNPTITIREILRGTKTGIRQSVGVMEMIPLILESEELNDTRFVSPLSGEVGTQSYGSLDVKNESKDLTMIVPLHVGYVVSESAQDHALCSAGIIAPKKRRTFDTAACIQETQGGTISSAKRDMMILPFAMREKALAVRSEKSYSKLWGDISEFNRSMGITKDGGRGHLEYFLKEFKDRLDEFIAEFEIVENQIGAIILINGHVVGVERAPSIEYFREIYQPLIRECYGSLALKAVRDMGDKVKVPKTRLPLSGGIKDIRELYETLGAIEEKEKSITDVIVKDLIDDDFEQEKEEELGELTVSTLKHKQFLGQVVRDGEKVVYGSFFTSKVWDKSKEWHKAGEFKI